MKKSPTFLPTIMHIIMLFVASLLFLLVKSSALLGTLGFESANLFAIILGPFLLLNASLNTSVKKNFTHILLREVLWLGLTLGLISTALFINGFFLTSCSLGVGIWPFLVVIFPTLLLNVSLGSLLAPVFSSRRLKLFIVICGYLLYYAWIIFRWWQHGTFRVLSHASILMSSDLVEGDTLTLGVVGFRTATLLFATALILLGMRFLNAPQKKALVVKTPIWLLATLVLLALGLDFMSAKALGKDRSDLIKDYSMLIEKDGIKVFFDPLKLSQKQASAIVSEALYYKEKLSKKMGLTKVLPITIWLHQNPADKFLYTGAKNVHFALPKQREIHIDGFEIPHGVLGHELAHIFIGEFSSSWLGYPSANGLVPNLAITEGLATALTNELNVQNDLTLMEQAQALYQAQVQVPFEKLFSANPVHFAMLNPRVSYIYAGAAVEYALSQATEKAQKIQTIAKQGSIAGEKDQKAIFEAFISKLKEPVAPFAITFARKNFNPESIITSDCSDKVLNQRNSLKRALLNQQADEALAIIELSPKSSQVAFLEEAIDQTIKNHNFRDALSLIEKALTRAQSGEKAALKLKKLQCLAASGNYFAAHMARNDMNIELYAPGTKRYLIAIDILLSAFLAGEAPAMSQAIINYFTSDGQPLELVYLGFELNPDRTSATMVSTIGQYLIARFEMHEKRFSEALISINYVLEKKLLPPLLEKEAHLMRIRTLIELDQEQKASEALDQIAKDYRPAEMLLIKEQLNRLTFNHTHPVR